MKVYLKYMPYLYFALLATVISVKNLLHPAIGVGWWLLLHSLIVIIFVVQSKFRLWYGDLILSIFTFGYSFLLFLSALSRNYIFEWSWEKSLILILFLISNFYASTVIFINAAHKAK